MDNVDGADEATSPLDPVGEECKGLLSMRGAAFALLQPVFKGLPTIQDAVSKTVRRSDDVHSLIKEEQHGKHEQLNADSPKLTEQPSGECTPEGKGRPNLAVQEPAVEDEEEVEVEVEEGEEEELVEEEQEEDVVELLTSTGKEKKKTKRSNMEEDEEEEDEDEEVELGKGKAWWLVSKGKGEGKKGTPPDRFGKSAADWGQNWSSNGDSWGQGAQGATWSGSNWRSRSDWGQGKWQDRKRKREESKPDQEERWGDPPEERPAQRQLETPSVEPSQEEPRSKDEWLRSCKSTICRHFLQERECLCSFQGSKHSIDSSVT
ncbi:unnamed protein product [Durusdinium trenchii]|uniref:Uncharacterized protein n=1 Tax=Durusdinium trenchii TaxID=1381693 RepID=A0ABP0PRK5_9DINO